MKKTRTRFAPSPTGYMHIGNLRTALFEYLIAKHDNGDFILRIEDTDQVRQVEGATEIIYNTLKSVGMNWDEGPDIGGNYGPYIQSERLPMYKGYAEELIKLGKAHYCFCSEEEIEKQRQEQGESFVFHDPCKNLTPEEIQAKLDAGEPYVIRQTIDHVGSQDFDDEVYGHIEVDGDLLDEQVLIKSDGFPTYNFANVIDDHQMEISHVVRGNEYLSSTPKYNLLYDAFGWERPIYVHVPPVMKDEHHKLSKRNGDASFQDLVAKGYLPDAIINYIALLGWSPENDQEIFSMDELIQVFDTHRISKRPAIFDIDKLTWMNSEYIKAMPKDVFYQKVEPYLKKVITKDLDLPYIAELIQSRIDRFDQEEITEKIDFFEELPEDYDLEMYKHKRQKSTKEKSLVSLKAAYDLLKDFDQWDSVDAIGEEMMKLPTQLEVKNGVVLWPIRTALSGKRATPGGAFEIAYVLGKEESLRRIQVGIDRLEKDLQN
ncbi:MAG: glutamate--tRNA ligase [Absicoccus porci]|jgi:nondiscriminating glutamyl-tRNA synthetase|uniref:Glutamate--tRNA ligase n=1 Tax=Absicoccus porci TaxID=2486576 RepID=A0A3N0I2F4_9FIRM|nr:glutamate--tRNA ligase [Absicoccus porci]MCI6087835.1 glutamate--tRNA ligase [Absicoccus porci]MDD6460102.1 glutamate--tRNA ligase [Absicoccus porci]RNM31195.1 glutamate--tRNA ligase [Absicoccus porci]